MGLLPAGAVHYLRDAGRAARPAAADQRRWNAHGRDPVLLSTARAEARALWEDPAFTEANVFIYEVATLAVLCKNGREIFEKGVGESFWCELDPTAYAEFARYPH